MTMVTRRWPICLAVVLAFCGAWTAQAQTPATPGVCYAYTGFRDGGRLLTINLASGAGTLIADIPGLDAVGGLAIDPLGNIFGTDAADPSSLYRIDAATGAATLIGSTGLQFVDAIAFDAEGVLYATETEDSDRLYRLDPTTGMATLIGVMGASDEIVGLDFDPLTGTLFGSTGAGTDDIFTIDTSSGMATLVGSTGIGGPTPDIAFNQFGVLFGFKGGGMSANNNLIRIDKLTGAGSVVGPIGFTAVSGFDCFFATRTGAPLLSVSGMMFGATVLLIVGLLALRRSAADGLRS